MICGCGDIVNTGLIKDKLCSLICFSHALEMLQIIIYYLIKICILGEIRICYIFVLFPDFTRIATDSILNDLNPFHSRYQ